MGVFVYNDKIVRILILNFLFVLLIFDMCICMVIGYGSVIFFGNRNYMIFKCYVM